MKINHRDNIAKVLEYINSHFDEDLSLERLSQNAHISQFHFHRLFTAINGCSLQQYIRWLKLKRAAYQLLFEKNKSILTIALDAGFHSHEAFTRAFKKTCGFSPSDFRNKAIWLGWGDMPYNEEIINGDENMKPVIQNFSGVTIAAVEHHGDPSEIPASIDKLIHWAKKSKLGNPKPREIYSIAYDDPKTTDPAKFRYDIGRVVTSSKVISDGLVAKNIPAGRVAVAVHKGSQHNIDRTVYAMYRDWLPTSGEELADFPCVFCSLNYAREVPESALETEVYLFLKSK